MRCPVRLALGTFPHQGGIPEDQLAALQRGLASFAIDSIPGVGLYAYEERPEAVVEVVRKASQEAAALADQRDDATKARVVE